MNQINETSMELLVGILSDESPYQTEFLERLEKETVAYCDEYAIHMARLQVLRPKIMRNHQVYVRLSGGPLREYTRLELAAPEKQVIESEAVSLATARPASTPAAPPATAPVGPSKQPESRPRNQNRRRNQTARTLTGNPLSLEEYVTFVNMVKQEFGVFPAGALVAQYYQTDPQRVANRKSEAIRAGRMPSFVNPGEQPGLLARITETFGPYHVSTAAAK